MFKKKKPITRRQFVINNLRLSSRKWPPKNECLRNARVRQERVFTGKGKKGRLVWFSKCNLCGKEVKQKQIQIDHKEPVVPLEGFPLLPDGRDDYTTYIERMFCELDQYQALCTHCHDIKTDKERQIRKMLRK